MRIAQKLAHQNSPAAPMKIGELAERAGVAVGTVRYYETLGLITPASRSESGYRYYDRDALERLCFIKKAQVLQFSLAEIARVLEIREQQGPPCEVVQALLKGKIAHLEAQILQMQLLKRELETYRDRWADKPSHTDDSSLCPLIEAVAN